MKKVKKKQSQKKIQFVFLLISLISLFILVSCETQRESFKQKWQDSKENFLENLKVFLIHFPIVKNYIKLPLPPKELYEEMQLIMIQIEAYKIPETFKEEHEKLTENWIKIQKLYQEKYYGKAEKLLKKTLPSAKELLEKIKKYYSDLKASSLNKFAEIEKLAKEKIKKSSSEEKLKVQLYLWKLKNLINLGKYEEFQKELEKRPF